jgi:hypothetical protein
MGYNATLIKDATSGFTDGNYSAMLDILPLYAKLIASAEFTLQAHRPRTAPIAGDFTVVGGIGSSVCKGA